jgi:hypothetical protein
MLFMVYWMASLFVWTVAMAFWYGIAFAFGLATPTDYQVAGWGWIIMASSQVLAVITIGFLTWAESRQSQ